MVLLTIGGLLVQAPLPAIAIAEQRLAVALLAETDHPDRDAFHAAQVALRNLHAYS